MLNFIVAAAENGVIGHEGRIPWKIPGEQRYFKQITTGHAIVMGRKTFESIGKPLPGRRNYVLTRSADHLPPGCSAIMAVDDVISLSEAEDVFVIGGAEVFNALFPFAHKVYLTVVHAQYPGDTFFPVLDEDQWELESSHDGPSDVIPHTFQVYRRRGRAAGGREETSVVEGQSGRSGPD